MTSPLSPRPSPQGRLGCLLLSLSLLAPGTLLLAGERPLGGAPPQERPSAPPSPQPTPDRSPAPSPSDSGRSGPGHQGTGNSGSGQQGPNHQGGGHPTSGQQGRGQTGTRTPEPDHRRGPSGRGPGGPDHRGPGHVHHPGPGDPHPGPTHHGGLAHPRAWDRCRSFPDARYWTSRDLMAEIQAMARRGFILVHPIPDAVTDFSGVAEFPAGWIAYGFRVAPGGRLHIRLSHPNEGWFRLIMMNK